MEKNAGEWTGRVEISKEGVWKQYNNCSDVTKALAAVPVCGNNGTAANAF